MKFTGPMRFISPTRSEMERFFEVENSEYTRLSRLLPHDEHFLRQKLQEFIFSISAVTFPQRRH